MSAELLHVSARRRSPARLRALYSHYENFGNLVDLLSGRDTHRESLGLVVEAADDYLVDNRPRNVAVAMRAQTDVVFKGISTVEKLADVSADVVLDKESPAWVLSHEFRDIKDQVIKDDKVFSTEHTLVELLRGDYFRRGRLDEGGLTLLELLEETLNHDDGDTEDHDVDEARDVDARALIVGIAETASDDGSLRKEDHEVAEEAMARLDPEEVLSPPTKALHQAPIKYST